MKNKERKIINLIIKKYKKNNYLAKNRYFIKLFSNFLNF